MTEIDELEGRELAAAVAAELGMVYVADMWWTVDESGVQHATGMGKWSARDYRPDLNIAQAWQLDGERWIWRFYEHWWGLEIVVETPSNYVRASADWNDFSSKARAYATVRCRAFLKAKTEP